MEIGELARSIDISCVRTGTTLGDIDRMAALARRYPFICAFALPYHTRYLAERLRGTRTRLGGTIAFPSGGGTTVSKVFEAKELLAMGCEELDMVVPVGLLKSGRLDAVKRDVAAVAEAAGSVPIKAILEVSLLTDDEIVSASRAAAEAGAAFIKTGTGWMPEPTLPRHVRLIRQAVGDRARIKAAGGIGDLKTLLAMRRAGCDRFGLGLTHAEAILREAAGTPSAG